MLQVIAAHSTEILIFLLALSEFLGGFDKIKANSIYQLFAFMIKKLAGK